MPPDMSVLGLMVFLSAFSLAIGVVVILNVVMAHVHAEPVYAVYPVVEPEPEVIEIQPEPVPVLVPDLVPASA